MECTWPEGLEPGSGKSLGIQMLHLGKMDELSFLLRTLKKPHFKIPQGIECFAVGIHLDRA